MRLPSFCGCDPVVGVLRLQAVAVLPVRRTPENVRAVHHVERVLAHTLRRRVHDVGVRIHGEVHRAHVVHTAVRAGIALAVEGDPVGVGRVGIQVKVIDKVFSQVELVFDQFIVQAVTVAVLTVTGQDIQVRGTARVGAEVLLGRERVVGVRTPHVGRDIPAVGRRAGTVSSGIRARPVLGHIVRPHRDGRHVLVLEGRAAERLHLVIRIDVGVVRHIVIFLRDAAELDLPDLQAVRALDDGIVLNDRHRQGVHPLVVVHIVREAFALALVAENVRLPFHRAPKRQHFAQGLHLGKLTERVRQDHQRVHLTLRVRQLDLVQIQVILILGVHIVTKIVHFADERGVVGRSLVLEDAQVADRRVRHRTRVVDRTGLRRAVLLARQRQVQRYRGGNACLPAHGARRHRLFLSAGEQQRRPQGRKKIA